MFVKHIDESNFFDYGFELNSVMKESLSKHLVDSDTISTYVQVWLDVNSYKYKAATNIEGIVERGSIRNKEDLAEVNRRFFEDHKREFLFRQHITEYDTNENIGEASEDELNKMIIKYFGDIV